MEDNLSYLPTTALLHSALQKEYPIAVRLGRKGPTLQFPEDLPKIHADAATSPATASSSSSATAPSTSSTPSSTSPSPSTAPSPSPPTVRFG